MWAVPTLYVVGGGPGSGLARARQALGGRGGRRALAGG
jgi:hypothetical protein